MEKLDNGVIVCQLAKVIESRCDFDTIPIGGSQNGSQKSHGMVRRQSVPVNGSHSFVRQQSLPHYHGSSSNPSHYEKDAEHDGGINKSQPQLDQHRLNCHHEENEVRTCHQFFLLLFFLLPSPFLSSSFSFSFFFSSFFLIILSCSPLSLFFNTFHDANIFHKFFFFHNFTFHASFIMIANEDHS